MSGDERNPGVLSLAEKVSPEHTAVVVVDYQNDFVAPGGALDQVGQRSSELEGIHDSIVACLEIARSAGARILFLRSEYSTPEDKYVSDVFFDQALRRFHGLHGSIPICVPGTWGVEFFGEVQPEADDFVVTKHRFGGFEGTDLDLILRSNRIKTLVFTGGITQVCVESTVRQAFFHDYYAVIVRDVVAGAPRQWHEISLAVMDWGFGEVVDLEEMRTAWNV
jgi:ureidoacrylate peracid hydrolase